MKQMFFLELPCFFSHPKDVDNLISGSSAFSKSSLYIWNFLVHILLKPSLKDFEHYLASMWNEHNCAVVWMFFWGGFFALLWDWNKNWPFPLLEMGACKWYFRFASLCCIKLCQHGVLERGWRAAGGEDCLLFAFCTYSSSWFQFHMFYALAEPALVHHFRDNRLAVWGLFSQILTAPASCLYYWSCHSYVAQCFPLSLFRYLLNISLLLKFLLK